jgi:inner membrane protein
MEKHATSIKLASIIAVALLLMIPKEMIQSTLNERQQRNIEAYNEAAKAWGGEQHIGGLILYVPVIYTGQDGKESTKYLHVLPESMELNSVISPVRRYRSIYEFVFFDTENSVKGRFVLRGVADYNSGEGLIKWSEAKLVMGIDSMEGISQAVRVAFGNEELVLEQGITCKDIFSTGISSKVQIFHEPEKIIDFSYKIDLRGSGQLSFIPVGRTNAITLTSDWKDPCFSGSFIPVLSNIGESGFTAEWKVIDLNRNYPQFWLDGNYKEQIGASGFGVKLINPIEDYFKIFRAVKYLFLFIVLTFAMFFLIETVRKQKIHPIQYLLSGSAITIFYILLLSISEHLVFDIAYGVSALAVSVMLCLYSISVLKSIRSGFLTGSAFIVLYAFLFLLLKNQDYALLLGSIGLFLSLGFIMYATKNTDWYGIGAHDKTGKEDRL